MLQCKRYARSMQFYEYKTTRDLFNKLGKVAESAEEFYKRQFQIAVKQFRSKSCAFQMVDERLWEMNNRPYYNVYPTIAPMLLNLSLKVDTSFIKLPFPAFCIRLTEKSPLHFQWGGDDWHIRSILAGPSHLQAGGEIFNGMVLWVDTGEVSAWFDGTPFPVHTYINLPLTKGMTLEESLNKLPWDPSATRSMMIPNEIRVACAKLVCTICLLDNNPELIEPDVLSADREKWEATRDPKYIEKAKRRHKFGFNVGRGIEVIPHVRRPHPALVWTEKGRTVPKIVMRRGSVIHFDKVKQVPTGFQDGDAR